MTALLDLPSAPDRGVSTRERGALRLSLVGPPEFETSGLGQAPTREEVGSIAAGTGRPAVAALRESIPSQRARRVRPTLAHSGSCARALNSARTARHSTGRGGAQPVRLTRRGRLTVTVLTLLATVMLLAVAAAQAGPAGGGLAEAPRSVVVGPGDTLWQIAQEIAPADSPVVVVSALREANELGDEPLQPGQVLQVPTD